MVSLEKYVSLLNAAIANFRRHSHKNRKKKTRLLARISKTDLKLKKGSYEGMAELPKEIQELYDIVGDIEHIKGKDGRLIDKLADARVDIESYKKMKKYRWILWRELTNIRLRRAKSDRKSTKEKHKQVKAKIKELKPGVKAYQKEIAKGKKLRRGWKRTEIMLSADLIRHLRKAPGLIDKRIQLYDSKDKLRDRNLRLVNSKIEEFKTSIIRQGGEVSDTLEKIFRCLRLSIDNQDYNSKDGQKFIKGMLEKLSSAYPTDFPILTSIANELQIKNLRYVPNNRIVNAVDWLDAEWKKPIKRIFSKQKTVMEFAEELKKLAEETDKTIGQILGFAEKNYKIIHEESRILRETLKIYNTKFNYDAIKSNLDQLAELFEQEKKITTSIRDSLTVFGKSTKGAMKKVGKLYVVAEDWTCKNMKTIYITFLLVHTVALLSFYFYTAGPLMLIKGMVTQIPTKYFFLQRIKYYSKDFTKELEAELAPYLTERKVAKPVREVAREPALAHAEGF